MALGSGNIMEKTSETAAHFGSPGLSRITVDQSVEFSYEEFAKATVDFSIDNKIGQARVHIALDLARGPEYIHEHTVPVNIHHVVKSANILIDKNFRGKFEDVLRQPDPRENFPKLVDPRLGDDYPLDSVCKMAQLARACTHRKFLKLRPSMRSVVVALMILSSNPDD
ncbi:PREDICTED: chitin elicitor receptor kinase 1-like [Populus euphratica]|uniref:Chitin elicitor receptor kinase 1-like n=1 Tax=Populus euphratica TaxID=75702 RepID=A0AAJ6VEP0_POPEU|nr:PREDICTED: chitin elicitor receptor kinase 1-like [Populus euphratica]